MGWVGQKPRKRRSAVDLEKRGGKQKGRSQCPAWRQAKGRYVQGAFSGAWFLIRVTARCHIQPQHKETWQRKRESIKFGASWAWTFDPSAN